MAQDGRFKEGNTASLQHGGRAALQRVREGEEFTGLARARQDEIECIYTLEGPSAMVLRNAHRQQVVSDLYFDAIVKSLEAGDLQKADALIKTWGWITNSATRGYELVREELKRRGRNDTLEAVGILSQYKERGPDASDS